MTEPHDGFAHGGAGNDGGKHDGGKHDGSRHSAPRRGSGRPGRGRGAHRGVAPHDATPRDTPRSNPRVVAYDILTDVLAKDAYANLLTPRLLSGRDMPERDRAFATDLVYGTLRWMRLLDAIVTAAAKRPREAIDGATLTVLRLGAYQSLFLGVPDHAAVSQSVSLARRRVGAHAGGFVNAVMHRVVARGLKEWQSIVTSRIPRDHAAERLGVRWSHPDWIVQALDASWRASGYDDAAWRHVADDAAPGAAPRATSGVAPGSAIDALLERDNEPPSVTLVARPGLVTRDEIIAALPHTAQHEPGLWSPYALRVHGVTPERLEAVRGHRAGVEDEGSQLAALALAACPLDGPDAAWLDMCAGPGGKTALLASIAAGRHATVTANEPTHHRAELVRENVSALPDGVIDDVLELDGRTLGQRFPGRFDRVLVDAPCSGLGALRRRPEARWRKEEADLTDLAQLQLALLESALGAVRPGGVVAYVTCSPALPETTQIVDAALEGHPDVERCDATAVLRSVNPGIPLPTRPGDVQLFGHVHDTDQMFISLLRRTA